MWSKDDFSFVSMVFWVTKFKYVINFLFVWCRDVMTSCHDVAKPDLPISACRCARKMILFFVFMVFRSLSSKKSLTFYFCDAVTSWRHVMTSLNLINLSLLVDELENWFFFCFHGYVGHWFQRYWWIVIRMMSWRHDVMSWRHKNCLTYLRFWIQFTGQMIVFRIPWLFWLFILEMLVFMYFWDDIMSWRHDVTSWRHFNT